MPVTRTLAPSPRTPCSSARPDLGSHASQSRVSVSEDSDQRCDRQRDRRALTNEGRVRFEGARGREPVGGGGVHRGLSRLRTSAEASRSSTSRQPYARRVTEASLSSEIRRIHDLLSAHPGPAGRPCPLPSQPCSRLCPHFCSIQPASSCPVAPPCRVRSQARSLDVGAACRCILSLTVRTVPGLSCPGVAPLQGALLI